MTHKLTVAALSMNQENRKPQSAADNLRYVAEMAAEIAPIRPDLIVLPEIYPTASLSGDAQVAEHGTRQLQELAAQLKCLMAGSLYLERAGRLYNTTVVVGRQGEILGGYDKIHPTEGEIERGVTPGAENQAPIRTEIGVLGSQICFDANWPAGWESQVAQGAEMILFPSAFPGGRLLEALATTYTVWVVPAIWSLHAGVIDNTGRWLARTDRFRSWACATIDLDRTVFHWDFQGSRVKEIVARYGPRIRVEMFGPEAWFTLEPADPDLSIREVIDAFELVTYRDYIARATGAQDAARPRGEG